MSNLTRFFPSNDLSRMQREFDRLFNDFFPTQPAEGEAKRSWVPSVDLSETKDAYHLHFDVPGIAKEDITINFHDGVLTVSGERKSEEKAEDTNHVRLERSFGSFYRSFNLPAAVKANAIKAVYKDGVLEIEVPKADEVKPLKIKVA
ncbi:MAG: Hsp20/alpha crystallin family protein [Rhodothermales bacterium]